MTIQIWREIFLLTSIMSSWWKNLYFGLYSPRVIDDMNMMCRCVGGRHRWFGGYLLPTHLLFGWKDCRSFSISSISIFVSNLFSTSGSIAPWHIGYEILNIAILWWVEPFSTIDTHCIWIETNDEFYFKHDEHPHILWGVVKPYFQLILLMLRLLCDLQILMFDLFPDGFILTILLYPDWHSFI